MKGLFFNNSVFRRSLYLNDIFAHFGGKEKNYNWLISYYEYLNSAGKYPVHNDYIFLNGLEMHELIEEGGQWVWGGFSAFEKRLSLENILEYPLPDPYENVCHVFQKDFRMTNPLAEMEIDAWDGTYSTIIMKDEQLFQKLKKEIRGSVDLYDYNQESNGSPNRKN